MVFFIGVGVNFKMFREIFKRKISLIAKITTLTLLSFYARNFSVKVSDIAKNLVNIAN